MAESTSKQVSLRVYILEIYLFNFIFLDNPCILIFKNEAIATVLANSDGLYSNLAWLNGNVGGFLV